MYVIDQNWTKPGAMALPKEGYFEEERGRYGPVFPRTPACYGFTIIANVIPGREDDSRTRENHSGRRRERSQVLDPLKLHYLR